MTAPEPRGEQVQHERQPGSLPEAIGSSRPLAAETGLSQAFIAFDSAAAGGREAVALLADEVVRHLHGAPPESGDVVRYPGDRTLATRQRNLSEGVPVDPDIWRIVQA